MRTIPALLKANLSMIERSAKVKRYHNVSTTHTQNVGEHTYGVMWLVLLLTDYQASRDLLAAALMHDTPEYTVGDIPAPTKRMPGVKALIDTLEQEVMAEHCVPPPLLTHAEEHILKLADNLEGALFSSWELRRGNIEMLPVLRNFVSYVVALYPQGVALDILDYIKEQHREHF